MQVVSGFVAQDLGTFARSLDPADSPRMVVELGGEAALVYARPERGSPAGRLRVGTVPGVFERVRGPGCAEDWLRIGRDAWICGTGRTVREGVPQAERWPPPPGRWAPLPFLYVHPLGRGRMIYDTPLAAVDGVYGRPFRPATWECVVASFGRQGTPLYRTASGAYLRQDDVRLAAPSALAGVFPDPESAPWPYAFVAANDADVFVEPPPRSKRIPVSVAQRLPRYTTVGVAEEGVGWGRGGEDQYLRRDEVRRFRPHERPDGVGPGERWFDVDLTEQVFSVWDGDVPHFVTLASTGKGGTTREGSFRIWRAAAVQTMTGLPTDDGGREYDVRDVPWVLFFDEDRAIHAAFWHDDFGNARSHGCVNLSPVAARWVFDMARPSLPDGWMAIDPPAETSTLVYIHR